MLSENLSQTKDSKKGMLKKISNNIKFAITIIKPPNYPHNALQEIGETVYHGLLQLGHDCIFTNNLDLANRQYIILGANLVYIYPLEIPTNAIIYNFEQIYADSPWLKSGYIDYLLQYPIWDYSKINIKQLKSFGINNVQYVPVGYVPQMTRVTLANEQDIDLLFYGSINARRQHIIDCLEAQGVKLKVLFGVYGEERDRFIARSKIILNMHFYEAQVFEVVRVSYLLANRKFVISEIGSDLEEEQAFSSGLVLVQYDQLVDSCVYYLQHPEKREAMAARGFNLIQKRPAKDYLAAVIPSIKFPNNEKKKFIKDLYRKRLAKIYLEGSNYEQAIALYEQSLQVDPHCAESYWYLGLALLYHGDELAAQLTWCSGISGGESTESEETIEQLLEILEGAVMRQLKLNNVGLAEKIKQQILGFIS
jgi:tetratricopeptide (TPR) repeat protein